FKRARSLNIFTEKKLLYHEAGTKSKGIAKDIADGKSAQSDKYKDMKNEVTENIEDGSEKAKHSSFIRGSIKPSFANSDKNKK
ncbi:MAG: hypothetical protein WCH10_04315, partial [bacterium]